MNNGKKMNQAGGGCLIFFGLIFGCMGLFFIYSMSAQTVAEVRTYQWEKVTCEITSCEIQVNKSAGDRPFLLMPSYQYVVDGMTHSSTRYTLQEYWSDDYEKLALLRKGLLQQSALSCYVDPRDAAQAVLKRDGFSTSLQILFPLIFVIIGGAIIWGGVVALRKKKREESGETQSISKSGGRSKTAGRTVSLIFGAIFVLVGGGLLIPFGVMPFKKMVASKNWQQTPCEIIWSRVQRHVSTSDGNTKITYSVDIFYEYEVNGVKYRSDKYDVTSVSSGGKKRKNQISKQYPRGSQRVCFVDPQTPERALLKRGFSLGILFGLIPLTFFLVGVWVVRFALKIKGKPLKETGGDSFADAYKTSYSDRSEPLLDRRRSVYADSTSKVLRPGKSRLMQALVLFAIALFWNGIVFLMLSDVLKKWHKGNPDWGLTIFAIPFLLVGIVLIGVFIYKILSLNNPKPDITLRPGILQTGQSFEVSWKIASNAARIQHFKIELWGVESATYRRGTNTHTSREVFYAQALFESSLHSDIRSGLVDFELPVDMMPSLNTGNNAIEWELRVTGDIPRWPDIQDNYKIEMKG